MSGKKGSRIRERADPKLIDENYVVESRITETGRKIIDLVYEMRAVKTKDIITIMGAGQRYIQKVLQDLYEKRFLDRRFPQAYLGEGSSQAIYFLDEAGKIFVAGSRRMDIKQVKWRKRENLIYGPELQHTLGIAGVRATITEAARKRGGEIKDFRGDTSTRITFNYEAQEIIFEADAFLTYKEEKTLFDYFLEFDRGTMTIQNFTDKIKHYEAFYLSGEYKNMYEAYPVIMVITTSMARGRHMVEEVKKRRTEKDIIYLFTSLEDFEKDTFGKIYITDNSGQKVSILD